jgi:hypothetical protein
MFPECATQAVVKGSTLEHLAANTITNEPNATEQAKLRNLFGTCFCLDEKVSLPYII